jgi:CheY-like chemotaxis protein
MRLTGPSDPLEESRNTPPVLIVDDVAEHRAATAATLIHDGYPVLATHDGDTVLRQVRARLVRLVVAELYIPCSEGRCVVMCLKQEKARLPRVHVLVHTRHTADADVAWALDAGCDGMVPKTAPAAVLLREVRRLDPFSAPHPPRASDLGVVHSNDAERQTDTVAVEDPQARDRDA